MKTREVLILRVILIVAVMFIAGCGGKNYKEGSEAADSIQDVEQEAIVVRERVNATVKALDNMFTNKGNLKKQFKTYIKSLDELESQEKRTRKRIKTMASRKADYLKRWESQMATIDNKTLRQTAQQRRRSVEEMFANVKKEMEAADRVFDPFIQKLKDIQTAMNMDLNRNGLNAVRSVAVEAKEDARKINGRLDAAISELSRAVKALSTKG
ncbi:DUF2959 family protein [Desulfopila sp. IMCC35008]|uniref:DUF2959 family protein n=1 Tax=Desulfopila sp. IMCC35008 TaxID=2653858 RepID=UPI0013D35111|nr:DUF2959 family protein [Desulfopila sp. IMCC35008]